MEQTEQTVQVENSQGGFSINRNQLKYLFIIAMLVDHIAWAFVPTASVLGQCMHFFGRLTGPGMAVLLAEGYQYTRNKLKYAVRLFLFALVSWVPYSLNSQGKVLYFGMDMFGVIWTLFLAFLTVWMWDKMKVHKAVKVILVIIACLLSLLGDWCIFAVLWALYSFLYRDNPRKKWTAFGIVAAVEVGLSMGMNALGGVSPMRSFFQTGVVLVPLVMIFLYNGKPGSRNAFHKWFFYVFYPLHILIIYFVKTIFINF